MHILSNSPHEQMREPIHYLYYTMMFKLSGYLCQPVPSCKNHGIHLKRKWLAQHCDWVRKRQAS
jgi:hypothetical protein